MQPVEMDLVDSERISRRQPVLLRRRWWVLGLSALAFLLVAALPGPDTPSWLAHPAWSPQGDALYFEAQTKDGLAIFFLALPSPWGAAAPPPQRLTEGGHRRPAPLSSQVVLCERQSSAGDSTLVLVEHSLSRLHSSAANDRAPRYTELRITKPSASPGGLREPALGVGKRGPWLAFSASAQRSPEDPARCDLFVARVHAPGSRLRQKVNASDGVRVGSRPAGDETP